MFASKSATVVIALIASACAIPMPDAGSKPFTLKNGQDAITLNNKFQSLSASSQCTSGEDACIKGQFAQCANNKFVLTGCAAGTVCAALPLVNKPGTAVTCTTATDRDARIAATGASGGGAKAAAAPAPAPAPAPVAAAAASTSSGADVSTGGNNAKPFTLANGKAAQQLNAKFATLTPNSPCQDGETACINGQFATCANSKFALTPCGGGLTCFALPLVNKAGTSNTCDTEADAVQRIQNTGAGNTLTGN